MLRLALLTVVCFPVLAMAAAPENLLFFGDFESGNRRDRPAEFWHRVGDGHVSAYPDWKIASEAPAAGKFCATTTTSREFVVCGECSAGKIAGAVMLRASRPTLVHLRLSWWSGLRRADKTRDVQVSSSWQRLEIEAEALQDGPVELAVAAKEAGVQLWADEFQVRGAPPADPLSVATHRVSAASLPDLAAHLAGLQPYDGPARDAEGEVALHIDVPPNAERLPAVSGGVPFPQGRLFRPQSVRVRDAAGREVQAQVEALARWHRDRSVKMLLVTVPTPEDSSPMTLSFGTAEAKPPGAVKRTFAEGNYDPATARPSAVDGEGRRYEGRIVSVRKERTGSLVSVVAVHGELRSDDGRRLGRYVTRHTLYANTRLVHIAHCWINDEPGVVLPIQSAALDVPAGSLALRDMAQNQPFAAARTERGHRVELWPESAKGVLLPQGFARQWDVLLDFAGSAQARSFLTQSLPVLRASGEWMCASGVFEFLLPPDPQTFPIFEQRVGAIPTLGRFAWSEKEKANLFGLFNFGDAPGDGGWSNLESMADHELFLHWMRTGSREHFDMARLAAEHYRDVDIHHGVGFCHTHCNNHTASPEGWSHAWIQGVRDLYLLLGDLRALEVLYEIGECLLTKEVGWTSGRDWTRSIDNLVDIFAATGDRRFLECARKHVEELGRRRVPANAVCGAEKDSWYEDRYEAGCAFTWYGCQAMAKLHYETGDPMVLAVLRGEMDSSLDVQTKSLRSQRVLPGERVGEDRRAYVLANPYALGRGSTLFPPLGYLAEVAGERRYLELGMKILAHYMLNLRGGSDASATAYATVFLHYAKRAGLGLRDEAAAFRQARDFSFVQWPTGMANGGFEDGFLHWSARKIPGQNFYYDSLVRVGYYIDEKVKRSGTRSLRLRSDNRSRLVSVTGSFGLKPMTRWRASVWTRADAGMNPAASISLREYDTDTSAGYLLRPTEKKEGGWEERAVEFMTVSRTVAAWTLAHRDGTGDAWFDDAVLEDLGRAEFALTNNGGGREWRKPAFGACNADVGGGYAPDEPMAGDAQPEGAAIAFTAGCLTDGESSYNHLQKPLSSYAYWTKRDTGSLTFALGRPCDVKRVRVNVLNDDSRKSHGTHSIELWRGGERLGVIAPAKNGWNEFGPLALHTDRLTLKFTRLEGRTYLTLSEVEIWGYPPK